MKLLICIDDTDNLESKGTGSIASEMTGIIEQNGWGKCGIISRHQLILHPDVPYTSHNSSMCFDAEIGDRYFDQLKGTLADYLGAESVPDSDPGICIAALETIKNPRALIEFGFRAKWEVLSKDQAYKIASETGVFLEEKGGSGEGIIGALAGVGLRLNGNDGEVKGGIETLIKGESYTVEQLLQEELIFAVCTIDMQSLDPDKNVQIKWKAKPVLHDGKPVLLVALNSQNEWVTLAKNEMRQFGDDRASIEACPKYKADVPEETVDINDNARSCFNCLYRRWTENSFMCTLK
ncbi:hypothetical protein LPY66_17345 [Dehalobacter sp. DCM]|uniref:hypothetical protein n=1 Tax=Dehalobacter sp. DCM TaxID=2907827 RepID=UPI003081ED63|nr:hypothetical protein LPY66_17345 [Dehalobacter sp. DCM]